MEISVVIPAYNEAGYIVDTINEIVGVLDPLVKGSYEVLVIDDHSYDETFNVIKNLGNQKVKCIRLSRNSGSHVALRAGLLESKGRAILCISADGQDNPSCIKDMLEKWHNGVTVIWALRRNRREELWYIRGLAALFYRFLFWLLSQDERVIDLYRADFFLLDRVVVNAVICCPERNTSLFGLLIWLGFKQGFVEYDRRPRISGDSKWSFKSRFRLAMDWITAFSGLPLKISSLIGVSMLIAGLIGASYIMVNKLFFTYLIPAWAVTVVLILIIGGIQLIILGIIGEYLWRNLDESRKRPLYFIEKKSDDM